MGMQLDGASYMRESLSLVFPYAMGCWFCPFTTSAGTVCSLGQTSVANHTFEIRVASGFMQMATQAGGSLITASVSTIAVTAGQWYYAYAQAFSATSKIIFGYNPVGATSNMTDWARTTTSLTPTVDTCTIGGTPAAVSTNLFSGIVAEWFVANVGGLGVPATPDSATIDTTIRQLAEKGPWMSEMIQPGNILAYRSLITGCETAEPSMSMSGGEDYQLSKPENWTVSGGPDISVHPPYLTTGYVWLNKERRLLEI